MKTIALIFFILFCCQPPVYSIVHSNADSVFLLHAVRDKHIKNYAVGNSLKMFYKTDSGMLTIKGKLLLVLKDSIDILPFEKTKNITRIAILNITDIGILHKNARRGWPVTFAVLGFMVVIGLLITESVYGVILFAIGAGVLLYLFLPFLFFSFLSDYLSKKSVTKGWRFYTDKGVSNTHHYPAILPYSRYMN